ncbi:zinc finger protein 182-like [Anopheles maculipalpis]|uniref:zinc finger protein 182-like n=1 Tax=Anopheles maculipalpis TaxID=1496333 RepID=UPI002158FB91|nr:zinc finger protein 182-like [Anopheles maculipalpis]
MDCVSATQSDGNKASYVCRGCGGKDAIKPLSVYGNVFKWCTSVDVSCSDGLPSNICNRCLQMLTISYEFKILCTRTDRNFRAKKNEVAHVESVSTSANISSDDFKQSESAYIAKTEEIVEEMVIAENESFDYLFENITKLDECIAKKPEGTKQDAICDFELLSDHDGYLVSASEKSDETTMLDAQKPDQTQDKDEHAFTDTLEYLEEACNEISSVDSAGKTDSSSKTVSLIVRKDVPKSTKAQPVRHFCPDCGKSFASRTNMYRHQHAHKGSKPYKCDICKKGFTQSGTLKTHKFTHFNIKPFVCNVCGQRFTQSKSVKLHLRRHTGEKPYVCDICNAAFRQKNGLQRHMKVHGDKA